MAAIARPEAKAIRRKSMNFSEVKLRANVAGILRRPNGEILVCERLEPPGAWQFPQGGIDDSETPEQALIRELREEIGVGAPDIRIVQQRGPYRYVFGEGRTKKGFHGKEQIYFLCDFVGNTSTINVTTVHPEFRDFRWIKPAEFQLAWLPKMKHEVYRQVFRDFFDVNIT